MYSLHVLVGNIVDDKLLHQVDAVVLPTNPMMRCGAGISGAIFHKAGVDALESYTERRFGISYFDESRRNEMKTTEVRITPGFALPCDIIFAQGPKAYDYPNLDTALEYLLTTYVNIFKAAAEQKWAAILLPALGTGSYGFSHEDTAPHVMRLLTGLTSEYGITAYLVLNDAKVQEYYK